MLGTAEDFAELGEDDVLAAAEACAETIRDAEAELLVLAHQWAIIHGPDRLDPAESGQPGREKAKSYGGDGTPQMCEFAAATFGARIGRSPCAAAQLIADALDLHHRLTAHWRRVQDGELRASYARFVAARTRDLTAAEAAYVDAAVAESADGRIPWSRFEALVEAKVAQAAPELAREKEERASRADATVDQRRVHAVLLMATGADDATDIRDLLPTVTLFLHDYAGPDATGVARLEGHGPVTDAWISRVLGPRCTFKVKPVVDLAGQAPVDAYEIPDRHRQAVHLMRPADTFPYASSLSRKQQVDHTVPHNEGGESGVGNDGPMTLRHHRIKTHAKGWQVKQPLPGSYVWRDPTAGSTWSTTPARAASPGRGASRWSSRSTATGPASSCSRPEQVAPPP